MQEFLEKILVEIMPKAFSCFIIQRRCIKINFVDVLAWLFYNQILMAVQAFLNSQYLCRMEIIMKQTSKSNRTAFLQNFTKNITDKRLPLHIPVLVCSFFFGLFVFSEMMTKHLVNAYDGIWEYTYHTAGAWELSLGRWFWLYLDKLRFGLSNDPWTSILTIFLFSAGMCFFGDLFVSEKTAPKKTGKFFTVFSGFSLLSGCLFLSSTAVSIALSYRYMSPTFGLGFLLSILAVWVMARCPFKAVSIPLSGLLIALSMGLYQAYIGCTCLAIVGYFLGRLLSDDETLKSVMIALARFAACVVLGGILYIILLKINLAYFHVSLSDYNGANSYSILNSIKGFPITVGMCYSAFQLYFFKDIFRINRLQGYPIFPVIFVILGIFMVLCTIRLWKKQKGKAILFLILLILSPIACNSVLMIATNTTMSLQMTSGLALLLPMLSCVVGTYQDLPTPATSPKKTPWLQWLSMCIICITIYGNVYQVEFDQNAMDEGQAATITMTESILSDLRNKNLLSTDLRYCFVGLPAGNPMFHTSPAYSEANAYALFGSGWGDSTSSMKSWRGFTNSLCGVNINVWPVDACVEQINQVLTDDMPIYPADGYIQQVDDVVVIRIN